MDTRFHYDLAQKQLCFALKECVTTEPDIQLRFKGLLNTVTGGFQYRATLKKYVSTGTLLKGEGTTPLRIGGGVAISSDSKDEPFLTATCTKKIALLDGPDTLLHAKASVDYELRTQKLARRGSVAVSRRFMNLTDRQDLLLKAGLELDWPTGRRTAASTKLKPEVFFAVRENNWALHFRRQAWHITYDL